MAVFATLLLALASAAGLAGFEAATPAHTERGADGKLRIVQFGDSHTAADSLQIALRQHFQETLGDGGFGSFLPCAARGSKCSKGWTIQTRPAPNSHDEFLGLPGMLLETSRAGETIEVSGDFTTVRAFFLKQPGGGRVRFYSNGAPLGDMDLNGAWPQAAPHNIRLPRRDAQRLTIQTLGGAVRLLSLHLENDTPGVVYSPLGVVGARAENLLHINEAAFESQLEWEQANVVILAYGTNESSGAGVDETANAARLGEIVDRIYRAAPGAAVLLVGPPDRGNTGGWGTLPTLAGVIRSIEAAARAKGVGFLNLEAAMGGPGTAARWAAADPPLAQPDRTHFTPLGYQRLAAYIAAAVPGAASAGPAMVIDVSQKTFRIRTPDGRVTLTNDPATIRRLLDQGGTEVRN